MSHDDTTQEQAGPYPTRRDWQRSPFALWTNQREIGGQTGAHVLPVPCAPSDAILTSRLHVVTLPHLRFLRAGRSAVWGHIRSASRALNACHVCGAQVTASEPGRLGWARLFVELGSYFQHKDLVKRAGWPLPD